jgi:hypothetical protein
VTIAIPDTDPAMLPVAPAITLFGTDDPVAVVERASTIATALADVIKRRSLYKHIGQSDHVFVEGWTLLGSMLGVFAEVEWSRPLEDGWESRAVARTLAGRTVGAAESMCSRSESKWKHSDDYAIRSMAQTRAVSKALRLPLGFIMELAGYSATPADEVPDKQPQAAERVIASKEPEPARTPPVADSRAHLVEVMREHGTSVATLERLSDQVGIPKGSKASDEQIAELIALIERPGLTEEEFEQLEAIVLPPKPGTDEYKALAVFERSQAKAYWTEQEVSA